MISSDRLRLFRIFLLLGVALFIGTISYTQSTAASLAPYYLARDASSDGGAVSNDGGSIGEADTRRGKIYVVLGLDTEPSYYTENPEDPIPYHGVIDTVNFNNLPGGLIHSAMQTDWRAATADSYGNPVKLTWFLLASEMECQSTFGNCLITYDLMMHFAEELQETGDEIGWHYHNTDWVPVTGQVYEGLWSQLTRFDQSRSTGGKVQTLAEDILNKFLMERSWFPSSFRSGWTWENDDLSRWLENVVIYDYSKLTPLTGNYDWSRSPSWPESEYYHPSEEDYQSSGSMDRFLIQSIPISTRYNDLQMQQAVDQALSGKSVIFSLYSHAPSGIREKALQIDSLVHRFSDRPENSGVRFIYNTASEAMRSIRSLNYSHPPQIQGGYDGERFYFRISEDVFGQYPYVVLKFRDGTYHRVHGTPLFHNVFEYDVTYVHRPAIIKVGVAATDMAGNVTVEMFDPAEMADEDYYPGCGEPV
ncbi:MAG: hypothetical protein P1R58_13080, partial [bacterium]|nr:hypothetical protein [bacterium]